MKHQVQFLCANIVMEFFFALNKVWARTVRVRCVMARQVYGFIMCLVRVTLTRCVTVSSIDSMTYVLTFSFLLATCDCIGHQAVRQPVYALVICV